MSIRRRLSNYLRPRITPVLFNSSVISFMRLCTILSGLELSANLLNTNLILNIFLGKESKWGCSGNKLN